MAEKKQRSAAKKLAILAYADKHGATAAADRFNISGTASIYQWRAAKEKLEQRAAMDAAQKGPEQVAPIETVQARPKTTPPPPPEPVTTRAAITGLGPLIAEVRAKVIEELAEEVGAKLGELIDQRMPEIVAREIRKALTEQSSGSNVQQLRPVARRV